MKFNTKIVNYSTIAKYGKLKSNFYLSPGLIYEQLLLKNKHKKLADITSHLSNIGVNKRFYTEPEYGIPFVSNTDIGSSNPLSSCKYVSKKFCNLPHRVIKEGMTIVSAIGTIGLVAYASSELDGALTPIGNLIRLYSDQDDYNGFLYAFLKSKVGNSIIQKLVSGSVQSYLDPTTLSNIPIPIFTKKKQQEIHHLIVDAAELRVIANRLLDEADKKVHQYINIDYLTSKDYEFFGAHSSNRNVSTFVCSIKEIDSTTINAFNHSMKLKALKERVKKQSQTRPLVEVLDERKLFKTGSFPRVELNTSRAIQLVNQSDIFNTIIKGKMISRRKVKTDNLVSYGEVLIAGVGTLGEGETFCRVIYANKDLEGQLVSGEFTRMRTNDEVPPGYLFAWLNSDYGFRFIRNLQAGTKLCRPIPRLLEQLPVPILEENKMNEIHNLVELAHTKRYEANQKENLAIKLIEEEIDQWQ